MMLKFITALLFLLFSVAANAELYCAVEIGAKGVKARMYEFELSGQELSVKIYFKKEINATIYASKTAEAFSASGIDEAVRAADDLLKEMLKANGNCKTFIVASSAVIKATNFNEFKDKMLSVTNVSMEGISTEQEAKYGFMATVRPKNRKNALLIDIGSGNTNIGCVSATGKTFLSMEIPFGSVSLANKIAEENVNAGSQIFNKFIETDVAYKIRDSIDSMPDMKTKTIVYWIGGSAWSTATWSHPERQLKETVQISVAEINAFQKRLDADDWKGPINYKKDLSEKTRTASEKDWNKVKETFTKENLLAGTSIMKGILSNGIKGDRIFFSRNGQWIYGYTLEKFLHEEM